MHLNTIDIIVVIAYFVIMLGLGLYQARKVKNTGDFFAGGRKFNKFLMMMHALGTGTHADDPVVVAGAAFKNGLAGIWYTFGYLFVTPFYWLIAPLFRRSRFLTTADFFEARFGSKLGTLYAFQGLTIFALFIGTLLVGTGQIISAISPNINPDAAKAVMTVAFLLYGTAGGLMATVVTESIQGLLIVVMSLLLIPFGLVKLGGFAGLHKAVANPAMFGFTSNEISVWWIVAVSISMLLGIVAHPHVMEVCSTGKTEFEGRVGFTYGNFVKRLCSIGWALTGVMLVALIASHAVSPADMAASREAAFGTAIKVLLPPGFMGLMLAAILAAQMAAMSAFMVASSALFSRNIYKKHFNPEADDKKLLRVARWAGLGVVAVAVVFAMKVACVADALMWFWTLAAFSGLFMWAGVLWRKTNAAGAWASFFVMLAIWIVVGEPGQGISQHIARKNYQPAVSARLNAPMEQFSRTLLDVSTTKDGKPLRKEVLALCSKPAPNGLGVEIAPIKPSMESGLGSAMVVTSVADKGVAKQAGLKPGDVIVRTAKLPFPGIFCDKSLLHYRLLAYLPAGIIALIVGSLLGAPMPKEQLDRFYTLISTPVGKEDELAKQGIEVIYAGASKGHPWELNHGKAVNVVGFVVALVISILFVLLLWGIGRIGA